MGERSVVPCSGRASERLRDRVTDGGVTGAFDYMPSSQPEWGRTEGESAAACKANLGCTHSVVRFGKFGRVDERARVTGLTASSSLVCEARRDANRRKEEKMDRIWESHTRKLDSTSCAVPLEHF